MFGNQDSRFSSLRYKNKSMSDSGPGFRGLGCLRVFRVFKVLRVFRL